MNGPIDAELLGQLLDEQGPALALYASQWTDAADDCVQEALIELARQRGGPDHVVGVAVSRRQKSGTELGPRARRRRDRETRVMADRFIASQRSTAVDRDDSRAATEALEQFEPGDRETGSDANLGRIEIRRNCQALAISIIECSSAIRRGHLAKLRQDIGDAMFDEREPEEPELTPDLKAIEGKLARLVPASARVDRDRLMFEAGRAAAQPGRPGYIAEPSWLGRRVWPAATTLMTAASLLLAVSLVWQHQALQIALHQNALPTVVTIVGPPQDPALLRHTSPELAFSSWNSLRQPTDGYLGVRYIALYTWRGCDRRRSSETQAPAIQRTICNERNATCSTSCCLPQLTRKARGPNFTKVSHDSPYRICVRFNRRLLDFASSGRRSFRAKEGRRERCRSRSPDSHARSRTNARIAASTLTA